MPDDLDDRLNEARERMEAEKRLRAEHVDAEDNLTQEEYHLRRLDVNLDMIKEESESLENPGITGVLRAVLGGGQAKLDRKQGDLAAVEQEYDEIASAVTDLKARLEAIERQIGELGDAEADFAALCEEREKVVLARGDETADQLREVLEHAAWFKDEARKTLLAAESADAVIQRISTMYKALMRARKGAINATAAPVIAAGWITLKARGAKEHVSRLRDGLQRLHQNLMNLDTSSESHYDLEINRTTPMIEHMYTEELVKNWEQWAVLFTDSGHPMERDIHELHGHLDERLACCRTEIDGLERHRRRLLGNT